MDEMTGRLWVRLWLGLALIFGLTINGCAGICYLDDKEFIKKGYTKKMLPGNTSSVWVLE